MNPLNTRTSAARPLEALGIDEMEERAYLTLLDHPMATMAEVALALSLSPRKAQHLLDRIEASGLASHSPERPRRYIAAPPKLAIEALISQRQVVLERARSAIPELTKRAMTSVHPDEREQLLELITSTEAMRQIILQLQQTAQDEFMAFQRAPVLFTYGFPSFEPTGGVRTRTISDSSFLAMPGALDSLRSDMARGEEARIFPTLPIKMFIADRRIAIILFPLNAEGHGSPTLLVRSSSLLDALCALFELTWQQSTPVAFAPTGELKDDGNASRLSAASEQVISLLATGLNDKAIAHEAGISRATLNRRIAELMKGFATRTRFQLGWRAALNAFPDRLAASPKDKKPPRRR
jgi:DNA-binding CsgD family transcriptional regulator